MKVVHIITGLKDGGAEGVLFRLVTYDTACKHLVVSLTSGGKYQALLKESGINVTSLDIKGIFSFITGIIRLISVLKRERPSVVQTWMYHADVIGGAVARICSNSKVVWGVRHSNSTSDSNAIRFLAFVSRKLSKRVPNKIVSCSKAAAQHLREVGYDETKIVVIPNGYDFSRFFINPDARACLMGELNLPPQSFLIGCVARWNEQKDHRNLLRAIGMLEDSNAICLLVGNGCDVNNFKLAQHIAEFGLRDRVKVMGQRSDVARIMSAIDLHILPSSHGEAFPNVVAESMACGTPCVVTDVGDARAIVGSNGWVVRPRDSYELSEAIKEAIRCRNSGCLVSIGSKARESVVQRFDIEVMCENFRKTWS